MPLAAGTRLGSYEILAPLGAGGMGEVYRARDPRLGREVAIKVLPEALASDAGRRQRFEQEARAASALNHPNILTVHDVGETNGVVYLAMELVEGKTLRELVASGEPVPHETPPRHRRADGRRARQGARSRHRSPRPEAREPDDLEGRVRQDPRLRAREARRADGRGRVRGSRPPAASPTEPGTVMGTAGYMSPEQARGQEIDFRSDQFSLGTILYEMATGKRAFRRETTAETLVAIIRDEPPPLAQAAPQAPAPVRWIVERCLAKDPEERYASSKDLARDLKSVRDHLSETSAPPPKPSRPELGRHHAAGGSRPPSSHFWSAPASHCSPRAASDSSLRRNQSFRGSRFAAARSSRRASLPTRNR